MDDNKVTVVTMEQHMESRTKGKYADEVHGLFARAGNRIYVEDMFGEYVLAMKCKNATKAKKIMGRICNERK